MKRAGDWRLSPPDEEFEHRVERREERESLLHQSEEEQETMDRVELAEPCWECGDEDWLSLDEGLTVQCLNCGWIRPRWEGEEPEC
jgi:hypothetical protein